VEACGQEVVRVDAHSAVAVGRADRLRHDHLLEGPLPHVVADVAGLLRSDRIQDRLDPPEDEGDRRLVGDDEHRARARADDAALPVELLHPQVLVRVELDGDRREPHRQEPDPEAAPGELEGGNAAVAEAADEHGREHGEGEAHRQREARRHQVVELGPPVEEEDGEMGGDPGGEEAADNDGGLDRGARPAAAPGERPP